MQQWPEPKKNTLLKYIPEFHFETEFLKHSGHINVNHYCKSAESKAKFLL